MAPPPLESPTAPASKASPPSSANRRTKEPRGATQQHSNSSEQQELHPCTPSLRSRCCAWRSCVCEGQGDVLPQDDKDEQPQVLDSGRRFTEGGIEAMLRERVGAEVPRRTADRGRPSSETSVWTGRAWRRQVRFPPLPPSKSKRSQTSVNRVPVRPADSMACLSSSEMMSATRQPQGRKMRASPTFVGSMRRP